MKKRDIRLSIKFNSQKENGEKMLKEACVENFSNIPSVIAAGANRIELNSDLSAGGTTPSFGVIKKSVEYAHEKSTPVVVMIRPRGGDFVYTQDEFQIMKDDLQAVGLLGADGAAFGCLNTNKQLNKTQMSELINMAEFSNLEVVMHMAFDEIPVSNQRDSINWLAKKGVKRILTHGGNLEKPISDNFAHLKELVDWAQNKIEILPGGGITTVNQNKIVQVLGVNQLHGTKVVNL